MEHVLTKKVEGTGNMESITPTCSCGWIGHPEYAYNDDQYTNVLRQEKYHLLEAARSDYQSASADVSPGPGLLQHQGVTGMGISFDCQVCKSARTVSE